MLFFFWIFLQKAYLTFFIVFEIVMFLVTLFAWDCQNLITLYVSAKLGKIIQFKKLFGFSKIFNIHFGILYLNWIESGQPFHFEYKMNTFFFKSNNSKNSRGQLAQWKTVCFESNFHRAARSNLTPWFFQAR